MNGLKSAMIETKGGPILLVHLIGAPVDGRCRELPEPHSTRSFWHDHHIASILDVHVPANGSVGRIPGKSLGYQDYGISLNRSATSGNSHVVA